MEIFEFIIDNQIVAGAVLGALIAGVFNVFTYFIMIYNNNKVIEKSFEKEIKKIHLKLEGEKLVLLKRDVTASFNLVKDFNGKILPSEKFIDVHHLFKLNDVFLHYEELNNLVSDFNDELTKIFLEGEIINNESKSIFKNLQHVKERIVKEVNRILKENSFE